MKVHAYLETLARINLPVKQEVMHDHLGVPKFSGELRGRSCLNYILFTESQNFTSVFASGIPGSILSSGSTSVGFHQGFQISSYL